MKEIAKKITGISTPFGGVSWDPPIDEKKIAQQTIIFLEDRRVLFSAYSEEISKKSNRIRKYDQDSFNRKITRIEP